MIFEQSRKFSQFWSENYSFLQLLWHSWQKLHATRRPEPGGQAGLEDAVGASATAQWQVSGATAVQSLLPETAPTLLLRAIRTLPDQDGQNRAPSAGPVQLPQCRRGNAIRNAVSHAYLLRHGLFGRTCGPDSLPDHGHHYRLSEARQFRRNFDAYFGLGLHRQPLFRQPLCHKLNRTILHRICFPLTLRSIHWSGVSHPKFVPLDCNENMS